ncbi:MAG: NUDIX hydrolase [Ferruginibacter sp.]
MKKAAGILPICTETGRALICLRSAHVHTPNTWGTWGGISNGKEGFKITALREFREETRYTGSIKLFPAYLNKTSDIYYQNFVGLVKEEFTPVLNWEAEDYKWIEIYDFFSLTPLHPGLEALLLNSTTLIKNYMEQPSMAASSLVEQILYECLLNK